MKRAVLMLGLIAMASVSIWARQAQSQPDADGAYQAGKGSVRAPNLVRATAAVYPDNLQGAALKQVCKIEVIVDADGTLKSVKPEDEASPFNEAAITAVKQSQFEAGTLDGKPVPVRTVLWVPFASPDRPAIPEIPSKSKMTMPVLIHQENPLYTDVARTKKIEGAVLITIQINEEGVPVRPRVVRSLGYGLDENAVDAVRNYRFKPAMVEGVPIAVQITVEVNFHLYGH
jgi:TonB family protein